MAWKRNATTCPTMRIARGPEPSSVQDRGFAFACLSPIPRHEWSAAMFPMVGARTAPARQPLRSIPDGEPRATVLGVFQLVDHCDREILVGNPAAIRPDEQVVMTDAEIAGALARLEHRRG